MKKNKGNTSIGVELDRQAWHKREAAKVITDYSRMLESPKEKHKVVMMTELHWDQGITRVQTEKGQELERSNISDKLGAAVSKREEIKELAITYDLKFLPAEKFLCPERREYELTTMLSDFMEERKIDNNAFSKNNFYILADERHFIQRQVDIDDDIGVFVFYLPPKQTDNFVRVNNIGNGELTFKRYLRGWRRKEALNGIIHAVASTFAIAMPILGLITGGSFWRSFTASILFCLLAGVAVIHGSKKKGGFTMHTWNKVPPMDE